jgi:hypothetical protein
MNGITASCVIESQLVIKNGETVFGSEHIDGNGGSDFLLAAYRHFGLDYPRFYKMDPLSKLGWLTGEILLGQGISAKNDLEEDKNYPAEDIGIVLSNANASLDTDLRYFETTKEFPSPSLFVYTLPNIMIGEICIRHNLKGENAFFITNQFDADLLEQYVSHLMDNDILQACICGWVDLMGGEYKAVLFLVEKGKRDPSCLFTSAYMNKIFNREKSNENG